MKIIFCEETLDIQLLLSMNEAINLESSKNHIPCLTAECKNLVFHIMNSKETSNGDYIKVKEPRDIKIHPHYWVSISDRAYEDLIKNKVCGTRYNSSSIDGSSKVNVIVESL